MKHQPHRSHEASAVEIDVHSVKEMIDAGEDFLLLDCREPHEHAIANIAGSVLMPMNETGHRLPEIEPFRGQPIVVHCHHGGRSLQVVRWLRGRGFGNARNMSGGIDRWSEEVDSNVPRY